MSLIDLPTENLACYHQPALIDQDIDVSLIEDVYAVGEVQSSRWRNFINCESWDPKQFSDQLLRSRAYHARMVWESSFVLSFTDSNWLSLSAYEKIRDIAHFELRSVEFEMISFQLTCGMIGIKSDKNNEYLFKANLDVYICCNFILEKCINDGRNKKFMRSCLMEYKPGYKESSKSMAKNLDKLLFTLQKFLKLRDHFPMKFNQSPLLQTLTEKLRNAILNTDKVLIVV